VKRKTPEEKYKDSLSKQQKTLEEFTSHETEWAGDLITWYGLCHKEIPDDEYRACAFFINGEYSRKPGSLTLLYEMYLRCMRELPKATKENAFDLLAFRYKSYAKALEKGGF